MTLVPYSRPKPETEKLYNGESPSQGFFLESRMQDCGSGYTLGPHPVFEQPPETARFKATIDGKLFAVGVEDGGTGYEEAPDITVEPSNGASCVAYIAGPVVSVEVDDGGSGYLCPPDVRFSKPGVDGDATAIMSGQVDSVEIADKGRELSESLQNTVFVTGGGGSGCKVSVSIVSGKVSSVTVQNGGSGYSSPPSIKCGNAVLIPKMVYSVSSVSITRGGRYSQAPSVTFEPSGCIESISVSAKGSGYEYAPSVVVHGIGSGCEAVAVLNNTKQVDRVIVSHPGSGYKSAFPPQVMFVGGGGTGATATASVSNAGGGASATAKINGSITHVRVVSTGSGFRKTPRVYVDDESLGPRTRLLARIYGKVDSVELLNGGLNYETFDGRWPGYRPWEIKPSAIRFQNPSSMANRFGTSHVLGAMASSVDRQGVIQELVSVDDHPNQDVPQYPCEPVVTADFDGIRAKNKNTLQTISAYQFGDAVVEDYNAPVNANFLSPRFPRDEASGLAVVAGCSVAGFISGYYPSSVSSTSVSPAALDGNVWGIFSFPNFFYDNDGVQYPAKYLGGIWPWGIAFDEAPKIEVCDLYGSGCSVSVSLDGSGFPDSCSIGSPGSGYSSLVGIQLRDGVVKYSPPSITLSIENGSVVSASLGSEGGGFFDDPEIVVHGGGGGGCVLSLKMKNIKRPRGFESVTVVSGGSGYVSAPSVYVAPRERVYSKTSAGEKTNSSLSGGCSLKLSLQKSQHSFVFCMPFERLSATPRYEMPVGLGHPQPYFAEAFTSDSRLFSYELEIPSIPSAHYQTEDVEVGFAGDHVPEFYGGIASIEITNTGSGYKSPPSVTVNGSGSGCVANAVVSDGRVVRVDVVSSGPGYENGEISVSFSGGGGTGAAGVAHVRMDGYRQATAWAKSPKYSKVSSGGMIKKAPYANRPPILDQP